MDPDSWPLLQLLISLALSALLFLAAGVQLEESSSKETADSGVGVSLKGITCFLLCIPCLFWAMDCIVHIGRALMALAFAAAGVDGGAPAWRWLSLLCLGLFCLLTALFVAMVCVFLPLSWGRAHSEQYLRTLRFPLWLIHLFNPLARLVTMPARGILKARGVGDDLGGLTEEDVLDTVDELDEIDDSQKEMIGNIFELDDIRAADIMTHRTEIEAVPVNGTVEDITAIAIAYGYSRIPVYEGTLDHIVGVVFVKDLLPYVGRSSADADLSALWRKPLFVPESCRARDLMIDFKQNKMQLAVVVDEYGGTAGIVSMEDILESIVGDIEDEYDEEDSFIVLNSDGSLTCDGFAEVEDVYEMLGLADASDDVESDTIGGLLTELLGRIPKRGEHPSAIYHGIELVSLKADERRITSVSARLVDPEIASADD